MTLGDKKRIFMRVLNEFQNWFYTKPGYEIAGGQLGRTAEQQEIYIKTGKSKTKNSNHLWDLAIDPKIYVNGEYIDCIADDNATSLTDEQKIFMELGEKWEEICKKYEVEPDWGGRFGVKLEEYKTKLGWDGNHFGLRHSL